MTFDRVVQDHPAGEALKRCFPASPVAPSQTFQQTGLTKGDYLKLIAGNVDFWKKHQTDGGAIVDFYEADAKKPEGHEKQYSTPAFALRANIPSSNSVRAPSRSAGCAAIAFPSSAPSSMARLAPSPSGGAR